MPSEGSTTTDPVDDASGPDRTRVEGIVIVARPEQRLPRSRRASTRSEATDEELLRLVGEGSETAFRALFDRYGSAVYRVCREVVRDDEIAEDAAQEAFVRVWRNARSVDVRRGTPAAWLMTVARNAARNVARVRVPFPTEVEDRPDPSPGEDALLDRLWVESALGRLPEDERLAIELAYFSDLSHSQIAARLDEPLGTIKTRLRRAMGRLADIAEQTA